MLNKIDTFFKNLIQEILEKGFVYNDPTKHGIERKQIPYKTFTWNFKDGFPISGLIKSSPKRAFNEFKTFMFGHNNLKDLDEEGISYWVNSAMTYHKRKYPNSTLTKDRMIELSGELDAHGERFGDLGRIYPYQIRNWNGKVDQLDNVLKNLENNNFSTGNVISMWNPYDKERQSVVPSHTSFSFIVEEGKEKNKLYVKWNQDSVDAYKELPMIIMYYAYACIVFAEYLGMEPEGIIGNLSNIHLYDNNWVQAGNLVKDKKVTKPISFKCGLPVRWDGLDNYLEQLEYNKSVKLIDYKEEE